MANNNERYAGDFLEKLANDPKYQAMRKRKDGEQAKRSKMLEADQASLVQELRDANVHVVMNNIPGQEYKGPPNSVWDLVNTSKPYPQAIPVLLKHLNQNHHPAIVEGIVRALAVKEASVIATQSLIDEFIKIEDPDSNLKWVFGLAIAQTTTPETSKQVAELALDKTHGAGRGELPLGMLHADPKLAISYLKLMVKDPITKANADQVLKKLSKVSGKSN